VSVDPPLARRMPGFDARHATRRARRTRVAVAVLVVAALAAILILFLGRHPTHSPSAGRTTPKAVTVRALTTLAPWRLGAPISRPVVVAGTAAGGGQLVIIGGLTTGGLTASGAFSLDVTNGTLTQVGDLATTLDDAGGAVLGGQDVVFGGTSASSSSPPSAVVQALSATTAGSASPATPVPVSTSLGTLPQPRAAETVVTVGTTAYLVGGDNGLGPDPNILATADGRNFTVAATLPVPVEFPAVASFGGRIYVFGGLAATGAEAGQPVNTIQVVDIKTRKVTDTKHLPAPLAGAAAVVLGHDVLLAGGDEPLPASSAPTTGTSPVTSPSAPTSSTSTVWSFDPTSGTCTAAGHLAVAVAHAGVAVLGSTAWLVGGESDGTPVSAVQSLVVAPPPTPTPAAGSTTTTH
jgi:Kelch motif